MSIIILIAQLKISQDGNAQLINFSSEGDEKCLGKARLEDFALYLDLICNDNISYPEVIYLDKVDQYQAFTTGVLINNEFRELREYKKLSLSN